MAKGKLNRRINSATVLPGNGLHGLLFIIILNSLSLQYLVDPNTSLTDFIQFLLPPNKHFYCTQCYCWPINSVTAGCSRDSTENKNLNLSSRPQVPWGEVASHEPENRQDRRLSFPFYIFRAGDTQLKQKLRRRSKHLMGLHVAAGGSLCFTMTRSGLKSFQKHNKPVSTMMKILQNHAALQNWQENYTESAKIQNHPATLGFT